MGFIKNFDTLALTPERKIVLDLIEEAFRVIEPDHVLEHTVSLENNILSVKDQKFDLKQFERVFLIGFGKGSGGIAKILEEKLGDFLIDGYVIDNVQETFSKIHFTLGTHPLPSQTNIDFTNTVLQNINNLSEKDLVLVVICGGGSAMFESPYAVDFPTLTTIFKELLRSGATISEMNVIRKHLSRVKGGGLAKHLYPATVASLLFSDVPGSDFSVIASGPTVKDITTLDDVNNIMKKYQLPSNLIPENALTTLPTEDKYFEHVHNILVVSNQTSLSAMEKKAKEKGYDVTIYSDKIQGDARVLGEKLIDATKEHSILLVGGETTVHVTGKGKGGRNQTLVLAALPYIQEGTIIASFDSDGMDFYHFAGALGDSLTIEHAKEKGLDAKSLLDDDNTYEFFEKSGDGIFTDKLESNVSDLMIVFKK